MKYHLAYNKMGKPVLSREKNNHILSISLVSSINTLVWGVWEDDCFQIRFSTWIEDGVVNYRKSLWQRLRPVNVQYRGSGLFIPSDEEKTKIGTFALVWDQEVRECFAELVRETERACKGEWGGRLVRKDNLLYDVCENVNAGVWRLRERPSDLLETDGQFFMDVHESFFRKDFVDPLNPYNLTQVAVFYHGEPMEIVAPDLSRYAYWIDLNGDSYGVESLVISGK